MTELIYIKTWFDGQISQDFIEIAESQSGEYYIKTKRDVVVESLVRGFKCEDVLSEDILDELERFKEGEVDGFVFSIKPKNSTGPVGKVEVRVLSEEATE